VVGLVLLVLTPVFEKLPLAYSAAAAAAAGLQAARQACLAL
jgi:hypothetical protein